MLSIPIGSEGAKLYPPGSRYGPGVDPFEQATRLTLVFPKDERFFEYLSDYYLSNKDCAL